MKEYIFSTIIGAALLDLLFVFLPIGGESLLKYLRYIAALILALCIISPFARVFSDSYSIDDIIDMIPTVSGDYEMPEYVYSDEGGVREADEYGNMLSDELVFCDGYIRECFVGIANGIKTELGAKFGIDADDIRVAVAADVRDTENIELICIKITLNERCRYISGDVREHIRRALDCRTDVQTGFGGKNDREDN